MEPEHATNKRRLLTIGGILLVLIAFFAGTELAPAMPWTSSYGLSGVSANVPDGADLAPFFKAWSLLDENFVATATSTATTTTEDKVFGAIQGLASSFGDPYTTFFTPNENKLFQSEVAGDFGGVGMEIGTKDGILTVISPVKGTPAERAGVRSGDMIVKIDGKDASSMSVDDAVNAIRGAVGSDVTVTFERGADKPFDVTMTRAIINLPTVDTKLRPDGVFVITIYTFNANAGDQFRDAVRQFANAHTDKMIIDLRGNPGGYLDVAADIASWFLPVGDVVVTEDYGGKQPSDITRSRGYDVFTDQLKLAVLIDGGSASASEILSGALHDHGKATLVGEKSFGKGSVQELFPITPDTNLKITIARWLTPNGISISHQGITPDIVVPDPTDTQVAAGQDPQMDRAVQFLLTGK